MTLLTLPAWIGLALLLAATALVALRRPLLSLLRLLLRSSAALAVLSLLAPAARALGIALGVNPFNALVLGVLGAPGLGLLLMLLWVVQ